MCVCWTESRFFAGIGMAKERAVSSYNLYTVIRKRGGIMSERGEEEIEPVMQLIEE